MLQYSLSNMLLITTGLIQAAVYQELQHRVFRKEICFLEQTQGSLNKRLDTNNIRCYNINMVETLLTFKNILSLI